jgi:Hemerythrin HHE cation binding domain
VHRREGWHGMSAFLRHHHTVWPDPRPAQPMPLLRPVPRHLDALELLGRDHRSIKRMFTEFAALVEQRAQDLDGRAAIVGRLCCALMLHAQLEDEVFYPAVHAHLGSDVWTHHASDEHTGCQALIARLDEMEPGDADFDAVVFTITAYIEPHIDEEQGLLFPAIRRSGMDVALLGRRILERRKLLQEDVTQIGLPQPPARLSK